MAGKKEHASEGAGKLKGKVSGITESKKRVQALVRDFNIKFDELDDIRNRFMKEEFNAMTPRKSRKMLEEIKVPGIETIREDKKRAERK